MRYSFQGIVQDEFGSVVASVSVAVYNVRTTTLASIYSSWSGGSYVTSSTIFTNSFGRYQYYADDADYPFLSQFDYVMKKTGYNTQSYTAVR